MDQFHYHTREITYVLPVENQNLITNDNMDDDDIDLNALNCICVTKSPHISDITKDSIQVVDDNELSLQDGGKPVIEILGIQSKITFYQSSNRNYLVIQFKPLNRYFKISFVLSDKSGNKKSVELSNNRSVIAVDNTTAHLPIITSSTVKWQRLCLDLPNLMKNAFGISKEEYSTCSEVTMWGSCRIAKIFFQSKDYSDAELPRLLRLVDSLDIASK